MGRQVAPKVVLCDLGGVVVRSPFQSILDFERENNIPPGWINFAIRHSSPNGNWQRLERGEIKVDAQFFEGFAADLQNEAAWHEFWRENRSEKKYGNPTLLGDHVSLKAEEPGSRPADEDRGSKSSFSTASSSPESKASEKRGREHRPSLSKLAKDTTIGDPISLEAEDVLVSDEEGGSQESSRGTESTGFPQSSSRNDGLRPMPHIDSERLFWNMMSAHREQDPYIFPALERLRKKKERPILGALSNTVVLPPDHPRSQARGSSSPNSGLAGDSSFDPASFFDVYVASAEVGMRKPSKDIYELAVQRLDKYDREHGGQGIQPEQVVFLDDIGENLKTAKEVGMKTIRVQLGKTWRAVKELESLLRTELIDDKTRRAKL
ncbi:MAG: hypothetical protein Q9163_003838 [Psora crenata]